MYVESWACSDSIHENFNYSYFKKTETVTPVTKIIIDQLQLSQQLPNCLNCVYQKLLLDTFLVTSDNQFSFKRKHATDLCI